VISTKISEKVFAVTKLLEGEYKSPRHNNKYNPLDELLFILLSLRTDVKIYEVVYKEFKRAYTKWLDVLKGDVESIAKIINRAGLAHQKASRLKSALSKIFEDFGEPSLRKISSYNDEEMFRYLLTLPGVGIKTAKCIMLYSFGRKVLPVDTHTYRISHRLGLIKNNPSDMKAHVLLEEIVPPDLRYSYHVNCVAHGRRVCTADRARCSICILYKFCEYKVAR